MSANWQKEFQELSHKCLKVDNNVIRQILSGLICEVRAQDKRLEALEKATKADS